MAFFETKYWDYLYAVFCMGIGILFLMLGFMKLFGLWGMPGGPAVFGTLIWYASVFELMIGMSMLIGVLVRLASAFGIIMMIVAYYNTSQYASHFSARRRSSGACHGSWMESFG